MSAAATSARSLTLALTGMADLQWPPAHQNPTSKLATLLATEEAGAAAMPVPPRWGAAAHARLPPSCNPCRLTACTAHAFPLAAPHIGAAFALCFAWVPVKTNPPPA